MAIKLLPPAPERRDASRRPAEVVMPVQLVRAASGAGLRCRVYDVTPDGLCVLSAADLAVGTQLLYETSLETFRLVVVWSRADDDKSWRVGLKLAPDRGDLTAVFAGFLASRRLSAGQ